MMVSCWYGVCWYDPEQHRSIGDRDGRIEFFIISKNDYKIQAIIVIIIVFIKNGIFCIIFVCRMNVDFSPIGLGLKKNNIGPLAMLV